MSAPRAASVLGAGSGLLVLLAAGAFLAWPWTRALDGEAWLRERYELGGLPFGLRVQAASRLPTGEEVVVLRVAGAPDEPPPAPPPVEAAAPLDWTRVAMGEESQPPREVVLVEYPAAQADGALRALFRGLDWKELRDLGGEGGLVPIGSGRMDWHGWNADFVHVRRYGPGGSFRDSWRVNLSVPGRFAAAHVQWTRGLPASRERVEEVLEALQPKVPSGPQ